MSTLTTAPEEAFSGEAVEAISGDVAMNATTVSSTTSTFQRKHHTIVQFILDRFNCDSTTFVSDIAIRDSKKAPSCCYSCHEDCQRKEYTVPHIQR